MDKKIETVAEMLFASPGFRVQLQLWFTEAIGAQDHMITAQEVDGLEEIIEERLQ